MIHELKVKMVICYAFHNILLLELESARYFSLEISFLKIFRFMQLFFNPWISYQNLRDVSEEATQWVFYLFLLLNFPKIQNQNQRFSSIGNSSVIVFHLLKNNFVFFFTFCLMNLIIIFLMVTPSLFKNSFAESQVGHYYYFIFYLLSCNFEALIMW